MNTYVITFLILLAYWKIKNQFNERLTIEFQYKIYDLRDKLREYTALGKINKYGWQFRYLDESLTNVTSDMDSLNLFTSIFLSYRLKKKFKSDYNNDKVRIVNGMNNNKYTGVLYEEYGNLLMHYVLRKAFFFRFSVLISILSTIIGNKMVDRYKRWIKKLLGNMRFFPDESHDMNLSC